MKKLILLFLLAFLGKDALAQPAEVVAKLVRSTERIQLRSRQIDSIVTTITALGTHRMSPSAKAVYDFVVAQIATVGGGHVLANQGIAVANRDTLDFRDDGDLDFTLANTTGKSTVTAVLKADVVDSTNIVTAGISGTDIHQQGATSGQVLKWNGTKWAPANDIDTGDDWGAQVVETDATLGGDGTSGDPLYWVGASVTGPLTGSGTTLVPLDVLNESILASHIAASAVTSSEIRDTTIVTADIKNGAVTGAKMAQDGATSGQVWKWNGTAWAPAADAGDNWGTDVVNHDGTLTGNGTSGSPLKVDTSVIATVYDVSQVLPAGTNTYTMRHNGTAWVASSLLRNDGTTIGINSAPNASYGLYLKGISSTGGLFIARNSGTEGLALYHNGAATVHSAGGYNLQLGTDAGALINLVPGGGGGQQSQVQLAPGANVTAALGNAAMFNVFGTYAPTTSGGDFSFFRIGSTLNQTESADQRVYGLRINPTLTSVASTFQGVRYDPSTQTFLMQPNGADVKNRLAGDLSVGIDTTLNAAKVQIQGDGATSSTYSLLVTNSGATTSTAGLAVRDDSRVGVGTNAPARILHVAGEARITDLTTDAPTVIVGADGDGDLGKLTVGTGLTISNDSLKVTSSGTSDHGALTGLSDDDHTQYVLLAGRSGGQTITGGTASGNSLVIQSTSNATRGNIAVGLDGSKVLVGGQVQFRGDISPSALSANTDDWAPTGIDSVSVIHVSSSSAVNLTGITGGADGRILYLNNTGSYTITMKDNVTSTAANRFDMDGDLDLAAGTGAILLYSSAASRWHIAGASTWARAAVAYTYTTAQTNTAVAVPTGAKLANVTVCGAGGGGGSGRRGASGSVRCGGGGGAMGGVSLGEFSIVDLGSPTTLYVTVGTGGPGGNAVTADDTNGNAGTTGGESSVKAGGTGASNRFISAFGGNAGSGGTNSSGTGATTTTGSAMFANAAGGSASVSGGAGSGATTPNYSVIGGGGASGGGVSSGNAASSGGTSSYGGYYSLSTSGTGGSSGAAGGNGSACTGCYTGGGGGGGAASTSAAAGAGGTGSRSGGGGGGGASVNGNNSGAGGTGGDGYVKVTFYF